MEIKLSKHASIYKECPEVLHDLTPEQKEEIEKLGTEWCRFSAKWQGVKDSAIYAAIGILLFIVTKVRK